MITLVALGRRVLSGTNDQCWVTGTVSGTSSVPVTCTVNGSLELCTLIHSLRLHREYLGHGWQGW